MLTKIYWGGVHLLQHTFFWRISMRKLLVALLALALVFAFTSCDNTTAPSASFTGDWIEGRGDVTVAENNNTTTVTDVEQSAYFGIHKLVETAGDASTWAVEAKITLPATFETDGNIGLWTDSNLTDTASTDGILAVYYDGTDLTWRYWEEDGTATGTDGQWKKIDNATAPVAGETYTFKVEYTADGFKYSVDGNVIGSWNGRSDINYTTLEWAGIYARGCDSFSFSDMTVSVK